jgi:hypothetical protein
MLRRQFSLRRHGGNYTITRVKHMPVCKKCQAEFPGRMTIEGKRRNLCSRKFCINCSPFNGHNCRDLTAPQIPGHRRCVRCKKWLQLVNFYPRRQRADYSPYCKQCTNIQTLERQRALKRRAIEYKGVRCSRCGYDRCDGALEFHHTNPRRKDVNISHLRHTTFEKIIAELDKCVLLCANCHREEHAMQKKGYL